MTDDDAKRAFVGVLEQDAAQFDEMVKDLEPLIPRLSEGNRLRAEAEVQNYRARKAIQGIN